MGERTNTERMAWLANIMWFSAADAGLPARWSIDFADATARTVESGTFDAELLRQAVDAAMDAEPPDEVD